MCGIVGFTGNKQAAPVLLDGLSKLEYRGYDSAGIAVRDGDSEPEIIKEKGKLKVLQEMTDYGRAVKGCCGIGHTRWATHGEPSALNAHPHASDDLNVIAVHNGIIENYQELREKLMKHGYVFKSQTDTEVAVKLIDYYYKKYAPLPIEAIARSMVRIRGSYALCVMFKDYPGEIYCARKDSPMIIGIADGESYVASDVPAILKYTRNVYYIGNMEIAKLEKGNVTFFNIDSEVLEKQLTEIKWDAESAEKGGYEHFMLKEIHEQPKVIRDTINSVVSDGVVRFDSINLTDEEMQNIEQVYIVACGSAYHVGVAVQYVIEHLTSLQVRVELASEFRYRKMTMNKKSLVIVISQSGDFCPQIIRHFGGHNERHRPDESVTADCMIVVKRSPIRTPLHRPVTSKEILHHKHRERSDQVRPRQILAVLADDLIHPPPIFIGCKRDEGQPSGNRQKKSPFTEVFPKGGEIVCSRASDLILVPLMDLYIGLRIGQRCSDPQSNQKTDPVFD